MTVVLLRLRDLMNNFSAYKADKIKTNQIKFKNENNENEKYFEFSKETERYVIVLGLNMHDTYSR